MDNSGNSEKATTMLLDEINANNEMINSSQEGFQVNMDKFTAKIKEVLNKDISAKIRFKRAEESLESRNRSEGDLDENGRSLRNEEN